MFTIGNEELKKCLNITEGSSITCHICGAQHKLTYGTNRKTGEKSTTVGFIKCPETGKSYLATIAGKLLPHMYKGKM